MLPASFYVIALMTFLLLLTLALGLSIKTIVDLYGLRGIKVWRVSALTTLLILVLFLVARFTNDYLYRTVLNYLGLVHFGFLVALLYWVPAAAYRCITGSWPVFSRSAGRRLAALYLAAVCFVVGLATYNFNKPEALVEINIKSEKIDKPVRFIHISDMQYGTTSRNEMVEKMKRVYSLDPDFIVFTGDLIDFEGYTTDDFEILGQSPVPIYFERGNHEFYHDPTRLLSDLNQIDTLRLLINRMDSIGQVDIVGIDFGRGPDHLQRMLSSNPLDRKRFSILLYHEPVDIPVGVAHGFDLMLFGHTHGGQIWPFTWVIDLIYKYGDGYFEEQDSVIYTSDGLSLWGPRMRLGSQNEIVIINLLPE